MEDFMTEFKTADEIIAEMRQETLDEALDPELSEDFFEIEYERKEEVQAAEGQPKTVTQQVRAKVQIKPLKIRYQKQFAKAFKPIFDSVAVHLASADQFVYFKDAEGNLHQRLKTIQDLSLADWVTIGTAFFEVVEVAPKLIQILCHNDGVMISDDEIDDCFMQPAEQQAILIKAYKKGGEMEQKIGDFFEYALSEGKKLLSGLVNGVSKEELLAKIAAKLTEKKSDAENGSNTSS
jgi:hypothetical protein